MAILISPEYPPEARLEESPIELAGLNHFILLAIGLYNRPVCSAQLREQLSGDCLGALDKHIACLSFPGRDQTDENARTTAFIDYHLRNFSALVDFQPGENHGFVLTERGQEYYADFQPDTLY